MLFLKLFPVPGGPRAWGMVVAALGFLLTCQALTAQSIPLRAETERLDPDQQREMDHLLADLKDPRQAAGHRRRAATILLDRKWPAANRELRRLLTHGDDPLV